MYVFIDVDLVNILRLEFCIREGYSFVLVFFISYLEKKYWVDGCLNIKIFWWCDVFEI